MVLTLAAKVRVTDWASRRKLRALSAAIAIGLSLIVVSFLNPSAKSDAVTAVHAAKRGNPWVNFQDGRDLKTQYVGSSESDAKELPHDQVRALSLTTDDLNRDGFPDLVCGYSTSDGGLVTLHLGDPEAFGPTKQETIDGIKDGQFPDPFLRGATVLSVPIAPDFIGVGDFDRDGYPDVLTAARNRDVIYLLPGNGGGRFGSPELLSLPGVVTTLVTGKIASAGALAGVAVGIFGYSGPEVLVYAGAGSLLGEQPEKYSLPGQATAIATGQLDNNVPVDLAVATGSEVLILHGAGAGGDEKSSPAFAQSQIEHVGFSSGIASVAVGDFTTDRENRMELAVLSDDGTLHVLRRGQLDTRPFTESEVLGRRLRLEEIRRGGASDAGNNRPWRADRSERWNEEQAFSPSAATSSQGSGRKVLTGVNLSAAPGEELIVMDQASNQFQVVITDENAATARMSVSIDVVGAPVALLPMRLNVMAHSGLVVLRKGQVQPAIVPAAPLVTFPVTKATDTNDGACNADCSLREAIVASNVNGTGADIITFNAGVNPTLTLSSGGGTEQFAATGDLDINGSLTITGNNQTVISTTYTSACGDCKIFGVGQNSTPGLAVSFSGVTIQNGFNNGAGFAGTFFETGGGIDFFLFGTGSVYSMSNCVVNNNQVTGSSLSHGAGINIDSANQATPGGTSAGSVTLTNVSATSNTSSTFGAGIVLAADKHDVTMTDVSATGNTATQDGGGIWIRHSFGGTVNMTKTGGGTSNISNNSASQGGGISNPGNQVVNITNVTISNNTATGAGAGVPLGGGIAVVNLGAAGVTGSTTLSGVTVSTNHADTEAGAAGGGIYFNANYPVTVSNCTIAGNTSISGAGVFNGGSGSSQILTLNSNTSISGNTATGVGGGFANINSVAAITTLAGITIDSNTSGSGGDGINQAGGTITGTGTNNVNGGDSVNISGGTFNYTSGTFNVTGNFTNSGGTFNQTGGTTVFNGSGPQSLGGSTSSLFNNLTVSKTGTLSLGVNTNVGADLTLTAGTFDLSSFTANRTAAGGTLTVSNGATLKIGGTNTLPSNYSTHVIGAASSIEYSGTTQNVATLNSSQKYGNLLTSGSGTKTLAGNISIATSLTIGSGTTLDANSVSSFSINDAGNWTNNGTFTPRSGTMTFDGSSGTQTLAGNTTFFNLTLNNSGATTSFGSTSTTIGNNLVTSAGTMNGGTSTITFTGAGGTMSGASNKNFNNLVINSGASISNTTGGDITIANDYTNAGAFTQAAARTTTFATGDGTHSITGSGVTTFGNATIQGSTTVDGGSHNFSVVGSSLDVTGTFNGNTGTVTLNGAVAQAITGNGAKNFSGLTINNGSGVTLNNGSGAVDASVSGLLTLTTDLTVAAGAILQQSGTSGGAADAIGTVRRTDLGATAKAFGNLNITIAINAGTAPNPMDVTLVKAAPVGFPAGTAVVPRTYTLTPTGGSGISATVTLRYIDPGELAGITEARLILWKNIAGTWTAQGGTRDTVNNAVSLSGVTGFSDWAIAEGSDLTVIKSNNVSGSAVVGQTWTWTLTVNNAGGAAADFASGQTMLTDNLPNSSNISYGTPLSSDANVSCVIDSSKDLTCTAGGSGATIAEAGSFTVQFTAVASAPATYANPRAGGIARVDPGAFISESDEGNNDGTDSVVVSKAATTSAVVSSQNPSTAGDNVDLTATISVTPPGAGTPTGTVQFKEDANNLGSPANVTGSGPATAQLSTRCLTVGTHTITGVYSGDTSFNTSTATMAGTQSVVKPNSVTVDDSFAGSTDCQDLGGGMIFNRTAFATIAAGQAGVAAGGTVNITAGTYNENVTVGSNSTLVLLGDITINGVLTLNSDLNTGSFTVTMPNTASSSTSCVPGPCADVVGNVKRTGFVTGGTALSFGNPFNSILFAAMGTTPADITVNLVKAAPSGAQGFPTAVLRTYTITPNGGSGYSATLRMHYQSSGDLNGNDPATMNLWRFDSNINQWRPNPATARDCAAGCTSNLSDFWAERSGVTQFSPWTLNSTTSPTAAPATISGRITTPDGSPLGGSVMHLSGAASRVTITDSAGNYHFDNVETDNFYMVTPSLANYSFAPASRSFSLTGNLANAGFTGNPDPLQTANAIDTVEYFVRQQYLDFLGREPDQGGLEYWSSQFDVCNSDATCIRNKRIDVSAAFFASLEFQQTGSYIYGLYTGTLGRTLNYAEFGTDRSQVLGGAGLDQAKTAFAQNFVQRQEFTNRYPQTISREQFVDAVLQTMAQRSGVNHSFLRDGLLNDYDTGGRALVVRHAAEAEAFVSAEYNEAFVLMEYFGYLRRELDQEGYAFWLDVLNNGAPGNYHGMVCAFVTSTEYQRRFSTVITHSNAECSRP